MMNDVEADVQRRIVDPQEAPLGYGQLRDALSRVAGIIQEETTK